MLSEALANVEKHARARATTVSVRRDERHLDLSVQDDGRGFEATETFGVGLTSIRSRAEERGGTGEVNTGSEGTSPTLLLPLSG